MLSVAGRARALLLPRLPSPLLDMFLASAFASAAAFGAGAGCFAGSVSSRISKGIQPAEISLPTSHSLAFLPGIVQVRKKRTVTTEAGAGQSFSSSSSGSGEMGGGFQWQQQQHIEGQQHQHQQQGHWEQGQQQQWQHTQSGAGTSFSSSSSSSGGGSSSSSSSSFQRDDGAIEFSASLDTSLTLKQHPQATFDDYLAQPDRIFRAFFPDKDRCSKMGDHTWRIHMLPLEFAQLSVRPVVDLDLVLDPEPQQVKYRGAKSVIHLKSREWQLHGVEFNPKEFTLDLVGSLYATHASSLSVVTSSTQSPGSGSSATSFSSSYSASPGASSHQHQQSTTYSSSQSSQSSYSSSYSSSTSSSAAFQGSSLLRGQVTATVAIAAPSVLEALPAGTISSVGMAVLTRLLGAMEDTLNGRVVDDYKRFVVERTGVCL